jgi:excisionase family DNA binding protein
MNEEHKLVTITEASKYLAVSTQTIRNWIKEGKLKGIKNASGRYFLNKQSLSDSIGYTPNLEETKENFIYCRVSSKKQEDDLKRQIEFLRSKFPNHTLITDIGSGINFKRPGLKTILELGMSGKIKELVVAHKDRLSRFGFEIFEQILELRGGKIRVIGEQEYKSPEQELSDDLLSIIHIFNCRQMGRRKYKVEKLENPDISVTTTKENIE